MEKVKQYLKDLGITIKAINQDFIGVSRMDMINLIGDKSEDVSYNQVLEALRTEFPMKKLHWSSRTDDYLYLSNLY